MAEEQKKSIIQLGTAYVKPKYYKEYLEGIGQVCAIIKKYGGTPIHQWVVTAGGGCEVIFLNSWPSIDTKIKAMGEAMKDPAYQEFHDKKSKMVMCWHDELCIRVPIFDINPVDNNTQVMIERHDMQDFPIYCAQALKDAIERYSADMGGQKPAAVLMPIATSCQGMIVIWPVIGGSHDALFEKWHQIMSNPKEWPRLACMGKSLKEHSMKFCAPVPAPCKPES